MKKDNKNKKEQSHKMPNGSLMKGKKHKGKSLMSK
jgi:hypothetical protein